MELANTLTREEEIYRAGYLKGIEDNTAKKKKQTEVINLIQSQEELNLRIKEHCGSFFFNFYKRVPKTERKYLFRFIYMSTYLNYDNYMSDGVRRIKESQLAEVLMLKADALRDTKKYLTENGYIEINDGKIHINDNYCKKGHIVKRKDVETVRIFSNAIRELYRKSKPREHGRLALLIELLPMINLKFNAVCYNPREEFSEDVQAIDMKDLCKILGYDETHSSRLKRDLFDLRVSGEIVVGIFDKPNGKCIYVNPRIYYKGIDINEFNSLANMFDI